MENKTDLIERLRKIANELENDLKPEFEVGKYHWTTVGSLIFIESINGDKCSGYGVNYNNKWTNDFVCYLKNIKRLATESEVLEALTKEAVKRGLVEGAKADLRTIDVLFRENYTFKTAKYRASCSGFSLDGVFIMQNGIWATVIKERSLEEWYKGFINCPLGTIGYIKSTKTELIEILKKLPND